MHEVFLLYKDAQWFALRKSTCVLDLPGKLSPFFMEHSFYQ
jgi:hypothetical protein